MKEYYMLFCVALICLLPVRLSSAEPIEVEPQMIETTDDRFVKKSEPDSELMTISSIPEPFEPEPVEVPDSKIIEYFDVPLSEDLQGYIFDLCDEAEIDPAVVIAMIETESNYNASALGDGGNSLGLMQIQPRWNWARMNTLGCLDLLDPYQNVTVGIDYLDELFETGNSIEWILMAYNGGPEYAYEKIARGVVSDYVINVFENRDDLKLKGY